MIGKKVALRAIEISDADHIYRWENDPDIWLVSNTITPFSRYIIEQYILQSDQDIFSARQLRLMIDFMDGNNWVPAGTIDLFEFDPYHKRAGVGILVSSEFRRQGIATEALQLLKTYAFETLQLHQLYCHIAVDNDVSIDLFRRCGFEVTGTRKEWLSRKNQWVDEIFLQCMNPEYHDKKTN